MGRGQSLFCMYDCVHASAQVDVPGAVQLEVTDRQTRAVEQLQSLLQESR